jgi:peptidoglycan/LPS O-acetylase OafA/YrhL
MPTFSEIYPIIFLLTSFLTTGWLVLRRYPITIDDKPRDIQVDGLRALLAFSVMASHYLFIVKPLIWNSGFAGHTPKITTLLGAWSVPVFFAITAYLFSQRLNNSKHHQGRSTLHFLCGRAFRLIPTALLACLIFLLTNVKVYTDTHDSNLLLYNWKRLLHAAASSVLNESAGPDSKLLSPWTWKMACGPHWTLHYEWIFYFILASLPVLSFKKQSVILPVMLITLMVFGIDGIYTFFREWDFMTWAFIPGILLGLTSKYWKNNRYLCHPSTAIIAITAVLATAFYGKMKLKIPTMTLFLAIVLSNNTATRFLESKLLRSLGETTYSVYLLHGLVQYVTLKWIITIPIARSMPEWLWWMTCALQVIFIVIIARLSFEYVEKPGIEAGKRFYAWLMNLIERRAKWLLNWI